MTPNVRLTQKIKSTVISEGADAVGFGPVERFKNAPEGYRPQDFMPDATGVISIGMHMPDGVCDVWGDYTQPGKSVGPYLFYGYGLVNLEISRIVSLVARMLEYHGYRALVFPPTWAIALYRWGGFKGNQFFADFSHRHAAVAAGLGEFGWSGLVMTPSFGARVRFNSVITNAPLEARPMYEGPAICQPAHCNYLCIKGCPAKALSGSQKVTIGRREYEHTKIDMIRCLYGIDGLVKGSGSYHGEEIPDGPGDWEHYVKAFENQHPDDRAMVESSRGIIAGDWCGRCLHQCPAHTFKRVVQRRKKRGQQ